MLRSVILCIRQLFVPLLIVTVLVNVYLRHTAYNYENIPELFRQKMTNIRSGLDQNKNEKTDPNVARSTENARKGHLARNTPEQEIVNVHEEENTNSEEIYGEKIDEKETNPGLTTENHAFLSEKQSEPTTTTTKSKWLFDVQTTTAAADVYYEETKSFATTKPKGDTNPTTDPTLEKWTWTQTMAASIPSSTTDDIEPLNITSTKYTNTPISTSSKTTPPTTLPIYKANIDEPNMNKPDNADGLRLMLLGSQHRQAIAHMPTVIPNDWSILKKSVHHNKTSMNASAAAGPIREVRSFVFHALHKTGSQHTRNQLRMFCHAKNLTCLTYCNCGLCQYLTGPVSCFSKMARLFNETNVENGQFTWTRLKNGCCPQYEKFIQNGIDGIVEHFPLHLAENRQFLSEYTRNDSFRFTIIREPIEQFVSYWRMLSEHQLACDSCYQQADVPQLPIIIDLFHQSLINQSYRIPSRYRQLHFLLTNSQSKELGWSGKRHSLNKNDQSINETLDYVETLDFIGLTEHMTRSWTILREKLGWSEVYFAKDKPDVDKNLARQIGLSDDTSATHRQSEQTMQSLSNEQIVKIKEFQWADYLLYEQAKSTFAKYS